MAKDRFYADEVERVAEGILGYHPDIADASIGYVFREGLMKSGGEEIMGKVTTVPAKYQAAMTHLAGDSRRAFDYIVEVSYEFWNNCNSKQRKAYLDELLSQCEGEMDEETGEWKYKTRNLSIRTSASVIKRQGAYKPEVRKLLNRLDIETDEDGFIKDESKVEELIGD